MQKLRVGIIGAGRIGQVHAKSITYHIPQAEIVAISDLFPENAQKVADDLGIPKAVQDYHEILNDPTVDADLLLYRYPRGYCRGGSQGRQAYLL